MPSQGLTGYDSYLSWLNLLPKEADSDDFTFVKST